MNKTSPLIEFFDLYGTSFSLLLFSKDKYKTVFGSLIGLSSIIAIITISSLFILDLLQKNSFTLIYNEDEKTIPLLNLTDCPMMFSLSDTYGTVLNPQKVYNYDVNIKYFTYEKDEVGNAGIQ